MKYNKNGRGPAALYYFDPRTVWDTPEMLKADDSYNEDVSPEDVAINMTRNDSAADDWDLLSIVEAPSQNLIDESDLAKLVAWMRENPEAVAWPMGGDWFDLYEMKEEVA